MKITLGSMFRDAEMYLPRYFNQINGLRNEGVDVRVVVAEGDSKDRTHKELSNYLTSDDLLVKVDHGGPKFGSVNNEERWKQIAVVMRQLVSQVDNPGDAFLWVEGDLYWEAEDLAGMLADLDEVPAVAPMTMLGFGERFYDVWGYRKDRARFRSWEPYYSNNEYARLVKIDSCGSCFALREEIWGTVTSWDGMWPFTAGGNLYLDPELTVRHP